VKIVGFDGNNKTWNLTKYVPDKDDKRHRSKNHLRAREILRKLFPRDRILEEVSLPGSNRKGRNSLLYADFFIPSHKLIVEVHGQQHYEFVEFYHKTKGEYYRSRKRDRDKIDWCEMNSLRIAVLKYSESNDVWSQKINGG